MNYELAKKLKDAGFKQGNENGQECDEWIDGYYIPTLSELIEACGENFRLQTSKPFLWQADNCGDFNEWDNEKYIAGTGNTSKEAVANLWLALNKK